MKGEIQSPNGYSIAYEALEGDAPGVLFLTGFKSDMSGQKAEALYVHCKATGRAFIRFDYGGHGASGGVFEEGTIGSWLADSLQVFDMLTQGKMILVGSSMGGWIALLLSLLRLQRIAGIIGIAAAPDFTERLIWNTASSEQKNQLMCDGFFPIPDCYGGTPYPITRRLIEEGRQHLLLDAPINIPCPVYLLHGTKDEDVPLEIAQALVARLPNVKLTVVQDGGHRLSEPEHLRLLTHTLDNLISELRSLT